MDRALTRFYFNVLMVFTIYNMQLAALSRSLSPSLSLFAFLSLYLNGIEREDCTISKKIFCICFTSNV